MQDKKWQDLIEQSKKRGTIPLQEITPIIFFHNGTMYKSVGSVPTSKTHILGVELSAQEATYLRQIIAPKPKEGAEPE